MSATFVRDVLPPRDALVQLVETFIAREEAALDLSKQNATTAAQSAVSLVSGRESNVLAPATR